MNYLYYRFVRPSRLRGVYRVVNRLAGETLLDVGYCDGAGRALLRKEIAYFGIDPSPREALPGMPQVGIEDFDVKGRFDIVLATEVLEHTTDPVAVIKKLRALARRYICVSVPFEPLYTLYRLCVPVRDHYFAISPAILRHYFGEPMLEKRLHLGRTYFAVYEAGSLPHVC